MIRRLPAVHLVTTLAIAAATTLATPARAQDSAAAEALFQQAKALTDQKKWSEACPKFASSYKLDKTLGTLLNLADCEEHTNEIASAWAHWGEAFELANKGGDKRAAFAGEHRDKLTPRLPMIRLDIPESKSALEVYRDGNKIDPAAYNVPLPSNPGPHTLTVQRGSEVLAKRQVTAEEAKIVGVPFDLVAIERAAPRPIAAVGPAGPQRAIGFAVLGVGSAAFVTAGILEIVALKYKGDANEPDACVGKFCAPAGADAVDSARTFANVGQWVGIAGIVVAAVGVTLVLTAPRAAPKPAPALAIGGWSDPTGGGLTLGGSF